LVAIALLLIGAGVAAKMAADSYEVGLGQGGMAAIVASIAQVVIAVAARARIRGAWAAAVVALGLHVAALALTGLLLLIFTALPWQGAGPLVGNSFNPVALWALAIGAVGCIVLYTAGFRSARALRDGAVATAPERGLR
jgi:hypothetical protein